MIRRQFIYKALYSTAVGLITSTIDLSHCFATTSKIAKIKFQITHDDPGFLIPAKFTELRIKTGNYDFYNEITTQFRLNQKLINKKIQFCDAKIFVEFTFASAKDAEEFIKKWISDQSGGSQDYNKLGYRVKHV